jgi:hypothetical protein
MNLGTKPGISLQAGYFELMLVDRALRAFMNLSLLARALWVVAAIQALGIIVRATG